MFYQETDFPGLITLIVPPPRATFLFATYFWVITLHLALTLTSANLRILAFRSSNPLSMIALSMKPMSASVTHRKLKTCSRESRFGLDALNFAFAMIHDFQYFSITFIIQEE